MTKRRAINKSRRPLKVDFIRYFAQDLEERIKRGEPAMEGRTNEDARLYVKKLRLIVSAVDNGDADEAYYTAWHACAWLVNSSVAIPVAKGKAHIDAHRRKADARRRNTRSRNEMIVASIRDRRQNHRTEKWRITYEEVARKNSCGVRTVQNAWNRRRKVD